MNGLRRLWRQQPKLLLLVGSLLVLLLVAGTYYQGQKGQTEADTQESWSANTEGADSAAGVEAAPEQQVIYTDLKGAVSRPGMYQVSSGARVLDVVDLAGGFTAEAATEQVNFSQLVTDQMVIYIPKQGETVPLEIQTMTSGKESAQSETGTQQVNINQADLVALQQLSGVGAKKAAAIIAYREEQGSFKSIADIKNVKGIGEKTFESLKLSITID